MEELIINTGLDSFVMADRIVDIFDSGIIVEKKFCNTDSYLCLETVAQAASMHVKWLFRFLRHSFLLKVDEFICFNPDNTQGGPAENSGTTLTGIYQLQADLVAQSTTACSYSFKNLNQGDKAVRGRLVIGTMAFDDSFREAELLHHNQELFKCLMKG